MDGNVVQNGSHVGYILPHEQVDYVECPTYVTQGRQNYIIHKPGSVCSDHVDGGVCPVTEMGVNEFYAPFNKHQQSLYMPADGMVMNPEQMCFVEMQEPSSRSGSYISFVKPDGKNFQSLKHDSPLRQQAGSVQRVGYPMYNTCEASASLLPFRKVNFNATHFKECREEFRRNFASLYNLLPYVLNIL